MVSSKFRKISTGIHQYHRPCMLRISTVVSTRECTSHRRKDLIIWASVPIPLNNKFSSNSSNSSRSFRKSKLNKLFLELHSYSCLFISLIDAQEAFPEIELAVLQELYIQANRSKPVLFEMCF